MTNLINKLTEQTQELRAAYILRTKEWASEEFERLLAFKKDFQEERDANKRWKMEKKYYSLPYTITAYQPNKEGFIADQISKAEKHYASSIEKLAYRIQNKGLNENSLEMTTSYLDPNISTTITDGEQTVRAFTIIAGGPVQKPHYRYLIK